MTMTQIRIITITVFLLWSISSAGGEESNRETMESAPTKSTNETFWVYQLAKNLLTYSFVLVPLYFLRTHWAPKVLNKLNTFQRLSFFDRFVKACVIGGNAEHGATNAVDESDPEAQSDGESVSSQARGKLDCLRFLAKLSRPVLLGVCFCGLMVSYLTWGVLQEKIMTTTYEGEKFRNSQFLVFVNRVLAFCFSLIYISFTNQPKLKSPLGEFSYCSLSNILSSWFQYEALKYVTFPTQVLAKACKVIPVMVMGKFVNGKTYKAIEYIAAVVISVGMGVFGLSRVEEKEVGKHTVMATTFSGERVRRSEERL